MVILVPIYSEQPLSADAQRVINEVLKEYPPGTFEFQDVTPNGFFSPGFFTLIVFGSISPQNKNAGKYDWLSATTIHTYSMAQLTTKANAVSVLKAALNQFYLPQKRHPKQIVWGSLARLDPHLPMAVDIETSGNLDVDTPEEVGIISVCFYQEGKWAKWVGTEHICGLDNCAGATPNGRCKKQVNDIVFTEEQKQILAMIENPIWHNGKFDMRVIEARTGVRMNNYFDTMLAHHVLNQAAGLHKLKPLVRQYLGAPEWEADLSLYTVKSAHYENIPPSILATYNGWDVYWTYELWKFLEPQILADPECQPAFMLEMAASEMLLDVEQYGFQIDKPYTEALQQGMTADVELRRTDLEVFANVSAGFVGKNNAPFNPGSWQQVQQVIGNLEGINYTGSTDEKTLTKMARGAKPLTQVFIESLLEYRGEAKALSTYVDGALKRERGGRVRTTFLIHGTSTGRLSSSSPNIQNIPRDKRYRSIYIG